jgi:hypothetical protein
MKYFLEQRLSSHEQNKWLKKMLGYDYEIIYKKGKYNITTNAFSQKHEEDGSLFSLSVLVQDWIEEVCKQWLTHLTTTKLIQCLQEDPNPPTGYTWQENILKYNDHLVLSPSLTLKLRLLNELYSSTILGYSDFQKTYACACCSFF